jgi:hypothetical protein
MNNMIIETPKDFVPEDGRGAVIVATADLHSLFALLESEQMVDAILESAFPIQARVASIC